MLLGVCCLFWAAQSPAGLEEFDFSGNVDEDRYKELIAEIRCLVCQNQSLADSDAELAHDLRQEVYDLMQKGQDNAQIVDFLVYRYGDFVLYKPPVKPSTYWLWYGPFALLILGIIMLIKTVRQRGKQTDTGFSAQEQARLDRILGKDGDDSGMSTFWILVALMTIFALLFVIPPLLRNREQQLVDRNQLNTEVIKDQLAELRTDLETGKLDKEAYEAASRDLKRELLDDLDQDTIAGDVSTRSGRWAARILLVLVPALALPLYQMLGTPQLIDRLASGAPATQQDRTRHQGQMSLEHDGGETCRTHAYRS